MTITLRRLFEASEKANLEIKTNNIVGISFVYEIVNCIDGDGHGDLN